MFPFLVYFYLQKPRTAIYFDTARFSAILYITKGAAAISVHCSMHGTVPARQNTMKEPTTPNTNTVSGRLSTYRLVLIAMVTAVTCILAPLSIPIPVSPVPISLTNLVLLVGVYLLGWKDSTISFLVYLLLGAVGLPVFSGFAGGLGKLAGPTGGYLVGFIFMTLLAGFFVERFSNRFLIAAGMALATAIAYILGTAWLAFQLEMTFVAALSIGVIPYLPGDAAKIIIAVTVGPVLKARLQGIW